MSTGRHTDIDYGAFMERNLTSDEEASHKYGRQPGKILAGHNAPDALIVRELPEGGWVYSEELAKELFGEGIILHGGTRVAGKYLSRLYTLAKKGYLESVVLWPHFKRYYRVLDIEKCRAEVTVKFLTHKYT